jgi:2-C-methyl-D-erythritol 2,4-cyclodiphosphate synthase
MQNMRTGIGYDAHRFCEGRDLIIGGVKIDYAYGLAGHSDADVLTHAIIDSLLGAAGIGDIGKFFPDTSPEYKNISSLILLKRAYEEIQTLGYSIINIDSIIICEKPKILPYSDRIKESLASVLTGVDASRINIKGKTTEGLGFTGRGEGIAAQAISLITL